MNERKQKAYEIAMKRRRGASHAHSEKVKQHMLAQDDLYTTCPHCRQRVSGALSTINAHVGSCNGH